MDSPTATAAVFIREPTPEAQIITKQKIKASVTPRTFKRFFTPRTGSRDGLRKKKRHALVELSPGQANTRSHSKSYELDDATPDTSPGVSIWEQTKSSPVWPRPEFDSTPSKRVKITHHESPELTSDTEDEAEPVQSFQLPIRRSRFRDSLGDSLRGQFNIGSSPGSKVSCSIDPYLETSDYYSAIEDVFVCRDASRQRARNVMPFCSSPCHTNSLVAVGDEDGVIRLLDTNLHDRQNPWQPYLCFQAHNNAILDIQFSKDDKLLATASGDQTCQVIDMLTQKAIFVMDGHSASAKQIRFQPGTSDSVLATSSRDGSIMIWDLRCKSRGKPVSRIGVSLNGLEEDQVTVRFTKRQEAARINIIEDAHYSALYQTTAASQDQNKNTERRAQPLQSRAEPSVTTLSFLSEQSSHILLSGADSQASVKVWDIRMTPVRHRHIKPLSSTALPSHHNRYRHWGLTSMAMNADSTRLYTLCKDNTVYVYSTSHLLLGNGEEFYNEELRPRRGATEQSGLGPLYGFRHKKMVVGSFYVKMDLRAAKDDKSEMLAVGSTTTDAVLFPTDERNFLHGKAAPSISSPRDRYQLGREEAEVPIYTHGTALVRGHEREITDVSWTYDGDLLTLGDDGRCRVWKEDRSSAGDLRKGGEVNGRRFGAGWAEFDDGKWDDND